MVRTDKWFYSPCDRKDCAKCRAGGMAPDHYSYKAPIWKRADTGEEMPLSKAPPGAMWLADWYGDDGSYVNKGPDGLTLVVAVPDGSGTHHWIVDSRASNCTKKDDDVHKCWIRHGVPPNVTVDKNGNTCSAGAGSIQTDKWHGFLRNGYLEQC